MIRHLPREKIQDKEWNGCLYYGVNGMPYAYSWFLDAICEEWSGLVFGQYDAVFPLITRKKFGTEYLYPPLFAQQLGVFALDKPQLNLAEEFLNEARKRFKYGEVRLNEGIEHVAEDWGSRKRLNLVLDLDKDYRDIAKNYSTNLKRNIKKAQHHELKFKPEMKVEDFVAFFEEHSASRVKEYTPWHHHALHRLIYKARHHNAGQIYTVQNSMGETLAANFYLFHPKRMIHLCAAANEEGKEKGAAAFLLDNLVQINAEKKLLLDFEGSDIESVARFYRSFGAEERAYFEIKWNDLPWFMKLFKR